MPTNSMLTNAERDVVPDEGAEYARNRRKAVVGILVPPVLCAGFGCPLLVMSDKSRTVSSSLRIVLELVTLGIGGPCSPILRREVILYWPLAVIGLAMFSLWACLIVHTRLGRVTWAVHVALSGMWCATGLWGGMLASMR